jgi:uncharacterized protein (DUF58 family)
MRADVPVTIPGRVGRRLFILPTIYGLGLVSVSFAIMLIALARHEWVFGGILVLPSMAFLCALLLTHKTLRRLRLDDIRIDPAFAGSPTRIHLTLTTSVRFASLIQCETEDGRALGLVTVKPGQPAHLALEWTPDARGHRAMPRLGFSTVYPWGVAQAWTWMGPDREHWVYPRPQGPSLRWMQANQALMARVGARGEEVYGLRAYRSGDDRRDIAWKASARSHQLMTRERPRGKAQDDTWLEWAKAPGNVEEKASAMTRWVIDADRLPGRFGLRLPEETIFPSQGRMHRVRCLQALALVAQDKKEVPAIKPVPVPRFRKGADTP